MLDRQEVVNELTAAGMDPEKAEREAKKIIRRWQFWQILPALRSFHNARKDARGGLTGKQMRKAAKRALKAKAGQA